MLIYKKDDISVSTVEEQDIDSVINLFSNNDFTYDYESSSLRPSNEDFKQQMRDVINGDKTKSVLVLKKNNIVIGYISMYISFTRLNIGHIAVIDNERNKGYGKLLTHLTILLAENDDRDICIFCDRRNNYYLDLGFIKIDDEHYLYEHKGIKTEGLPQLFLSIKEYDKKAKKDRIKSVKSFSNTLEWFKKNGISI